MRNNLSKSNAKFRKKKCHCCQVIQLNAAHLAHVKQHSTHTPCISYESDWFEDPLFLTTKNLI